MQKLFLLDAYALIYRAYYGFIRAPRFNSKGVNTSAIFGFVNTLEDILKRENPSHIGIAFDLSTPTFRHKLFPEYKAQREETPEAIRVAVPIIKDIIRAYQIPLLECEGYEADDVIGTLAIQAGAQGIDTYMMTPDKDYAQLVGPHIKMYRPGNGDKSFEILGVDEVCQKYGLSSPLQVIDLLGLMGDKADNVPGCTGVGEKTAVGLITQFGSTENMLEHTDEIKGKLREKVENCREQIILSKFLVTIKTDIPLTLDMPSLERKSIDREMLKIIFDELEFHSLSERILGISSPTPKKTPTQPSLFDLFPSDDQEEQKEENLTTFKTCNSSYKLVDTEDEMHKLCDYLFTFDSVSLDTETTSTEPMAAKLVGLSFAVKENEGFYVPVPQEKEEALKIVNIFKPLYKEEKILKIGQNIKYDLIVLKKYGIELAGPMFDTMIAHYILWPELPHNMDYMAEVLLKYKTIHIDELIGKKGASQKNMADLSPTLVCNYAAEDADVTLKLYHILKEELEKSTLMPLFNKVEMPLVPVLAQMEYNGVRLDTVALQETSKAYSEQLKTNEQEIYALAGEPFNILSPKQVGSVLFDKMKLMDKAKKTKNGQYVTSEEVLTKLEHKHEIVARILQYRNLNKLLSTYINALPSLVNPETGRIHSSFNQAVTATGRLSSSNPNLQNIPIRQENGRDIRRAFVPDEGCDFFSADYSQIELRIMAHLSQDEGMIEAFNQGDDIHAATAAKIYKKTIDEVTKEERSKAKTANFGIIYGISAFGLSERMGISRSEAKELIDGYFETYPKIKAYMDESILRARELGYTETIMGRRCYLPDINSHNSVVRGYAERNAINAPIQGSAADIVKVAMASIHRQFKAEGLRSKMLTQVHDELNFSVVPEEKGRVEAIVLQAMQSAVTLRVPLIADCGWGTNWLEAH